MTRWLPSPEVSWCAFSSVALHTSVIAAIVAVSGGSSRVGGAPAPVVFDAEIVFEEPAAFSGITGPSEAAPAVEPEPIFAPEPVREPEAVPVERPRIIPKPVPKRVVTRPEPKKESAKPTGDGTSASEAPAASAPLSGEGRRDAGGGGAPSIISGELLGIRPVYPQFAQERGQQGRVVCRAKLGNDGSVESVDVVQSSGFPLLDKAASRALERATISGMAAPEALKLVAFTFRLES